MRIAVVGAGGFVGRPLVNRLALDGHDVVPVVRTPQGLAGEHETDDIAAADWESGLAGVDVVRQLAARGHMMNEREGEPRG